MGMSTSEVSSGLPEGDPDAAARTSGSSELAPSEEATKPDGCDPVVIEVPSLVIKVPCNVGEGDREDDDAGFKTPTSADNKIPPLAECPPAPRKRRSEEILNSRTTPEGLAKCRRVLLDLSSEIQSSFAPPLLTNFGGKVNRRPKERDAAPTSEV